MPDYLLKSVIRSQASRAKAMASPVRHRHELFVGSDKRRLIEARPLVVAEVWLLANLPELKSLKEQGRLSVQTMDRREVDLNTLEAAPAPAEAPAPSFPVDSIMRDPPRGVPMPIFPGVNVPADVPMPLHIPQPVREAAKLPLPPGIPTFDAPPPTEPEPEVVEDVPEATPTPAFAAAEAATAPESPKARWPKGARK
jgi:hypothetical protein